MIEQSAVNRLALQLAGFFEHFYSERIQVIGNVEAAYMKQLAPESIPPLCEKIFSFNIPCLVFCRGLEPSLEMLDFVRRFFVSCVQIFEAYAVRTLMKFGYDWRKISHKSKCKKNSESTYPFFIKFISLANYTVRFSHSICQPKLLLYSSSS